MSKSLLSAFAALALALPLLPSPAHADAALTAQARLGSTPAAVKIYGGRTVIGSSRLVQVGSGGRTTVVTHLEGLRPGTTHAGHIHLGNCSRLFPTGIVYDLEPLVANAAGRAVSRTVLPEAELSGLADGDWWVAVHEGPENTTPQTPAISVGPVLLADGLPGCTT